jgi:agmatine deiminase
MSHARLPAEWEAQSGVMLTWPHAHSDWAPLLAAVEVTYVHLAEAISQREKVLIVCFDEQHRHHIQALLAASQARAENLRLHLAPSNDTWARDHGPLTVMVDGVPRLLDFRFNGWGGKYAADLDNAITPRLVADGAFGTTPSHKVDIVLEGGSIEADGRGGILTTRRCLLSPSRNPSLEQAQLEQLLREQLGAERILWLRHGGLDGDDTDGHIDTLARYCDAHTIAYVACGDPGDPQYPELKAMEAELQALRDADGAPYRLVPLPMPGAIRNEEGQRLPATYANFLIINGAVLVPTYGDPMDERALDILQGCFPAHEIIGIDARPLIEQFGSLHCITMQLPHDVIP